jgi:hypothetical protein
MIRGLRVTADNGREPTEAMLNVFAAEARIRRRSDGKGGGPIIQSLQRIRSILVFVSGPERGVDRLDKRMRIYRRSCPAGTGLLLPVGALRALLARAKVIATKSAAARRKSSRPRVAVDRTGAALAAARHVRGCPG